MTVGDSDQLLTARLRDGASALRQAAPAAQRVPAEAVTALVEDLLDPARGVPVVAVTTRHGAALLDADLLARTFGEAARVVVIETGDATRALTTVLPEKLCVYGGAGRIWWPGLSRGSDPYDHPLVWVEPRAPREAERRIAALVGRRVELPDAVAAGDEVEARVVAVDAHGADLEVGLLPARCPITRVARGWVRDPRDVLRPGQVVRARVAELSPEGAARLDLAAVQEDAWAALARQARPGMTVRGRVATASPSGVTVELLPGACGRIAPEALRVPDAVATGDVLTVTVRSVDPAARRADLFPGGSGDDPLPLRLLPDGPVFLGAPGEPAAPGAGAAAGIARELAERLERLEREAQELRAKEERLAERLRHERERNRSLTRDLGAAQRRLAHLGERLAPAGETGEERWERLVTEAYARLYRGEDRRRHPLAEVWVLPGFAASAASLEGVEEERIAEVCAHVAAGRAHEVGGLRVHPLRVNGPSSAQRLREDGARAWRAALQVGAHAARRLHYWVLTRDGRRVVELEAVGTHDAL